ncbi:MAG TPA: EamA family transporter [Actinomycetota bacterium]|nr:EamA family transporter [Actinomycetota bacterium]
MTAPGPSTHGRAPVAAIWTALSAVYVIWGTTYLAIRVANETLPPLIAAGVRFAVAGAVLYAIAVRRGDVVGDRPGPAQWKAAAIVGIALVAGGNGLVVLAERTIPSGIASLIIALVPLWMVLVDRVVLRHRVALLTVAGLVLGFGGAAMLIGTTAFDEAAPLSGMLVCVLATLSWTSGSLYSREAPLPSRPLVGAGMEMMIGGAVLIVFGALRGEIPLIRFEDFSMHSLVALAYLITFGSWIGFTSYVWLLRNARTSLVSTYAYVNPVVAVFLGWLILDEPITIRTVVAGAVIIIAVAIIISTGGAARRVEPVVVEPEREEAVA